MVSAAGTSRLLAKAEAAEQYLNAWKSELHQSEAQDFPTIREIFYLAYEAGTLFENLPEPKSEPSGGLIWRHQPQWSVCFNREEKKVYLSSMAGETELDSLEKKIRSIADSVHETKTTTQEIGPVSISNSDYQQAVEAVREYIRQGDIFQANIARFWQADCKRETLPAIYQTLRRVNPAPFSCYVKAGELSILSASPERLFAIDQQDRISARPIAGTRRRSEGENDHALAEELLLSEKERAEHIMLVDLERNDLGRVCLPGSVNVNECMVIEKYATVQHIVSNVTGKLALQYDLIDVFRAKFPGGTITGCPKVRCMEIIHELEPQARGPYTGGIGYIAWNGSVDMNILIRTFWHWQEQLSWAAGAGIVADSNPAHEELETEHKVAGLMRVFA